MDRRPFFAVLAVLAMSLPSTAFAGKATLKNGTVISGDLVPLPGLTERQFWHTAGEIQTKPFVMVDAVYKRYFVPSRQIAVRDQGQSLIPFDVFTFKHIKSPSNLAVESIGLPIRVTPFSDRGVRTVTLATSRDPLNIVQGVTRIEPGYVTVEGIKGISSKWRQGISTSAIPPDDLAAMLRAATDAQNPDDRMSIARFYLQAGMYEPAAAELEGIARDFPELAAKVEELDRELRQLRAKWLLSELRRRQAAGQHEFTFSAAEAFPEDLGFDAEVLRQVDELREGYRDGREKADRALFLLGELEGGLKDEGQRSAVAALRSSLMDQLDWNSLARLDAFLTLADDESLAPAERLALAYSGWVVGSAKATTDLPKAITLWRARHL
ncbi:MAG: hypothetical protein M3552_22485, partial [Planctomycetota bacterium]|nr:hypothetical protein [Planctomycetota bacterium]